MSTEPAKRSRLRRELAASAEYLRSIGGLDDASHAKIIREAVGEDEGSANIPSLSAADIRALRERENLSQAAFARHLNVTADYISRLERGAKRPSGTTLALLDVIRRKGIEALL